MHPGCIADAYTRPGMYYTRTACIGDAYPGAWNMRSTRPGMMPTLGPSTTSTSLPGGLTFAEVCFAFATIAPRRR